MFEPKISVVIPTLNAGKILDSCLSSIRNQNYPQNRIEIVIIDAGSTDNTVDIASGYKASIYKNKLRTAESGKAKGIQVSKNELILLIDSDNEISDRNWLKKMTLPFKDETIIASEPIKFAFNINDPIYTRYCALIGMNDPICLFLGNYDKFCYVTNTWTGTPIRIHFTDPYIKFNAIGSRFITMGANGFLVRRSAVIDYAKNNYYFDVDVSLKLSQNHANTFAKVYCEISHSFALNYAQFIKKQKRRIMDYLHFNAMRQDLIKSKTNKISQNYELLWFGICTILIVPLFFQMIIGFRRKQDIAWLFHPIACYTTLLIYSYYFIKSQIIHNVHMMDRSHW